MMKSKKNLARKILCGLLAAGVVGVAGSAMAAVNTNAEYNNKLITSGTYSGDVFKLTNTDMSTNVYANQSTISITAKDISIDAKSSKNDILWGAGAAANGVLNLGGDNTENVSIVVKNTGSTKESTVGIIAVTGYTGWILGYQPGTTNVTTKNLYVDVSGNNAAGLQVGNNTSKKTAPTKHSSLNVNAEDITINSTSLGLVAFSNGEMNINGNLLVNAEHAIDTRGYATININTDGQHTTVLNGDIVFETPATSSDSQNSGKIIDSYVNVNLKGEASSWTGKAYQLFNDETSVDINTNRQDYGDVTGFKLNISDGAAWNMTGDSFINNVNVADGGSINVQDKVKTFNADSVALDNGNLNIKGDEQNITITNLSNDAGTIDMQGSAQNVKIVDLTSDEGTINLQGKNQMLDVIDTFNSNGTTINLNGEEQDINLTSMSGSGAIVNTNSLDNSVNIGDKADETKISVHGSSAVTDKIASGEASLQDLANVVGNQEEGSEISLADTVTSDANDIIGGYSADVKDGKIVAGSEKTYENTTNRAISDMASISLMTWRQENNDMNKRLGELRDSKGEHGAWARMARGESKYGAQNVKNQYNYYQVGYDEKLSVNPNWTVGVALTRTEGNSTFAAGSGENKHTGVAIYGSYLNDNGSFIDLIAKYARMDNDFKTNAGVGNGDYETNGYSISAEYGKRFTKDNGFWIEPQVELTYGTVGSANYTTSKGASVYQESIDSLVGRLGFSLGKNIKQGNVYVRASYLYDFDGETKAVMSKNGAGSASFEQDLGGGWWEVGVGTNINLSDATHLYFDVEKTYGGNVATPWQWNAGVRWSF